MQQVPKPEAVSDSSNEDQTNRINILLTGSTGTLGTSILYALGTEQTRHRACLLPQPRR